MPEFTLDHGDADGAKRFRALDSFAQGYIEALFFTNASDSGDECNGMTFADVAPETLARIADDCQRFQVAAADLLSEAYDRDYESEQAGRDFWYTRNGHGVGFWDRDVLKDGDLGRRIGDLCGWRTDFREVSPYKGDDGLMYFG